MAPIGIIPARMGSSRFPGKPLAKILGMPMIGHVYHRAKMSSLLHEVYVATCDKEIKDYIIGIGGKVVMTSSSHERCTDRTMEAMLKIEAESKQHSDIVLMIQGDEPMITPDMLDSAVDPMIKDPTIQVLNLMSAIASEKEYCDPNKVKVVTDLQSNALYFSREPIPSMKKGAAEVPRFKQVCVIPFRRDFLIKFSKLMPTPLEIVESVDMMRILEHGYKVKMVITDTESYPVDTPEDLKFVEEKMKEDKLRQIYS